MLLQLLDFVCCFPLDHQEAETRFVPSVQDFDKKLSEADAYLQILIDQLKVAAHHCITHQPSLLCCNGNSPKKV